MNPLVLIPARMAATRLPGKPLADIGGQPMIVRSATKLGRSVVSVFILPPSIAALAERLRGRGQDSPEVIAARMAKARTEISHWAEYDYVLINDDLDRCYAQIVTIVEAERLRLPRQREMRRFVDRLNAEFDAE